MGRKSKLQQLKDINFCDRQERWKWWNNNHVAVHREKISHAYRNQEDKTIPPAGVYEVNLSKAGQKTLCGSSFDDMIAWCYYCCIGKFDFEGNASDFKFCFDVLEDAVMFKLTWGYRANPIFSDFEDEKRWQE